MRKHFHGRFEADEPASWIEHNPRPKTRWMQRVVGQKEFDRVAFPNWTLRVRVRPTGSSASPLGEPEWKHLPREEFASLIGREEVDRDFAEEP